ncbi:hypothetical protein NW759_008315 [Fusarium solani]|nr:hypothetical protein NW759_008315 [Fusarium solani]
MRAELRCIEEKRGGMMHRDDEWNGTERGGRRNTQRAETTWRKRNETGSEKENEKDLTMEHVSHGAQGNRMLGKQDGTTRSHKQAGIWTWAQTTELDYTY